MEFCSRLPKELVPAILFAAATAVPAWSRLGTTRKLVPGIVLFGLLCWINRVGIEKWEAGGGAFHATTRWAGLHLRPIVTIIALVSLASARLAPSTGLIGRSTLRRRFSSGLLFALDARSSRLSPLHLRIAADAALLTPFAFFPFVR